MIRGDGGATKLDDFVECNFVSFVFSIGGEVTSPVNNVHKLGYMADRVLRVSTIEDIEKNVSTFHEWEHDKDAYADIPGFCKSGALDEMAEHGYLLTPSTYVGAEEVEEDGVRFNEKMEGLPRELVTQFHESEKLQAAIRPPSRLALGVRPIAVSYWSANANN